MSDKRGLIRPKAISDRKEAWHWSFSGFDSLRVVRNSISELENGYLHRAAQLVDAMRRDDAVDGALERRASLLPSLPVLFEKGKGRHAEFVAKEAEDNFEKMVPDAELASLVSWGLMLGAAFAQLVWERTSTRWTPALKVWHPWAFHYRRDLDMWFGSDSTGMFPVEPGNGEWVVFEPYGRRGFMRGRVRSLYVPWILRQWTYRDAGRYSEVYGTPIKKGFVPMSASKESIARFQQELSALGNETTITLPRAPDGRPGFDLELIEARGDGMQQFMELAENTTKAINIALLGQNLTSDVSGGSFAAAKVHNAIRNDLMQADADKLSDCLNTQVLRPWAVFNFGSDAMSPKMSWDTTPPTDKTEDGAAMESLGKGIAALLAVGVKLDVNALMESKGYPVAAIEQPEEEEAEGAEEAGEEEEKEETLSMRQNIKGAIQGQQFTDAVAADLLSKSKEQITADVTTLLGAVLEAGSFQDLETRLKQAFAGMDAAPFAEKLSQALALAEMNGIDAVFEDASAE